MICRPSGPSPTFGYNSDFGGQYGWAVFDKRFIVRRRFDLIFCLKLAVSQFALQIDWNSIVIYRSEGLGVKNTIAGKNCAVVG